MSFLHKRTGVGYITRPSTRVFRTYIHFHIRVHGRVRCCVNVCPTRRPRRRSKRCTNFAGYGYAEIKKKKKKTEEAVTRKRKRHKVERNEEEHMHTGEKTFVDVYIYIYLNLNFEFYVGIWPQGTQPLESPGQPSDAVFGLDVLQFLNRIGRRCPAGRRRQDLSPACVYIRETVAPPSL